MLEQLKNNIVKLSDRRHETREQALKRLFVDHASALRGFLRVNLKQGLDSEDVIQEVFSKLAKLDNLPERLPKSNKSNRSFLFTMANNLVVDMERSKQVRSRYANQQMAKSREVQTSDSPESIILAEQELRLVKIVLMQMRPCWREAFILSRFRYRSYRQIALDMDISIKTVEKYIRKALFLIRQAVLDYKEAD